MTTDFPDDAATSWFDGVYRRAGRDASGIPWSDLNPSPPLEGFLHSLDGTGRAVIVGCGLGDDAEAVAAAGFDTIAFDVSPEAIAWCRERFPDSSVEYRVEDLLALPTDLIGTAGVVIEVWTIQSLPLSLRGPAIDAIVSLLGVAGSLLVVAHARPDDSIPTGRPWPVSEQDLAQLESAGLELMSARVEAGQFVRVYRRSTQ